MHELVPLIRLLDIAGLAVFAVTGVLVAVRKRVDLISACFFALVTAVGGGTLRDLLIDAPVFWMHDASPVLLCVAVAVAAWLVRCGQNGGHSPLSHHQHHDRPPGRQEDVCNGNGSRITDNCDRAP